MAVNKQTGDEATTPRDIPEYVQRHFKMNKDLGVEKIEEKPELGSPVYTKTPQRFSSNSPPGPMDVEDADNVSITTSPARSLNGKFDREAYINEQELQDKPTSQTLPLPNSLPAGVRVVTGNTACEVPLEPVHAMSMENLAMQEAPPGGDHTAPQPTKSKLQEYADEVYQNTVVRYQEMVRRGEKKLPNDHDRRTNRMWFERYSTWMATQKQTEQQKLQEDGFPGPFAKPEMGNGSVEHQNEGLPAPFPPPRKQSKGG